MASGVLEPAALGVGHCTATVARIVALAQREAARTGRPTRLQEAAAVSAILEALGAGRSRFAAAHAAGVSEGVLRRWLSPAGRPLGACRELQSAVDAIEAARHAPAAPLTAPPDDPSVPSALVPLPVARSVPAPPPAPVYPVPAVSVVAGWWHRLHRAARLRASDPWEADALKSSVTAALKAYGLREIPPEPDRWLAPGLTHEQIRSAFIAWYHETGQGGPTESVLEMCAYPWYRARVLPAS